MITFKYCLTKYFKDYFLFVFEEDIIKLICLCKASLSLPLVARLWASRAFCASAGKPKLL